MIRVVIIDEDFDVESIQMPQKTETKKEGTKYEVPISQLVETMEAIFGVVEND